MPRWGTAYIHRNRDALPRARLMGQPIYADDQRQAVAALERIGDGLRDQLVIEDPTRPLAADAIVRGTARISLDLPERVEIEADAETPAYLVLADTFDPGWSATVDGVSSPIRPAYVAFCAVYLTPGSHKIIFTYRPAGLDRGLSLTGCGLLLCSCSGSGPNRRSHFARALGLELAAPLAHVVVRGAGRNRTCLDRGNWPERSARTSHSLEKWFPSPYLGCRYRSDESESDVKLKWTRPRFTNS